jgi:hypothetical protein
MASAPVNFHCHIGFLAQIQCRIQAHTLLSRRNDIEQGREAFMTIGPLSHPQRMRTDWRKALAALLSDETFPLSAETLGNATRRLVAEFPQLPLPGSGETLARWQFLADVAAHDLALVKIYEAHADALAILSELRYEPPPENETPNIWAVWAARSPHNDLRFTAHTGTQIRLSGTKAWCSGARIVSHALVTCVDASGDDWLAAVATREHGVSISTRGWNAVGMAATQSVEVDFDNVRATLIGPSGAYVQRPGFWHGGAGIAACWYGGATALAGSLFETAQRRDNPHLHAHLGEADVALTAARACLRESAREIDAAPRDDAMQLALRTRGVIESTVETTLRACARGLGAAPFCRDSRFARMAADLPVFVRQSHAEADLAQLAQLTVARGDRGDWQL